MKNSARKERWTQAIALMAIILIILLTGSIDAVAQSAPGPPMFPSTPGEAPIDGGLGLLAAAGGAYAWKKLRDKRSE